MNSYAGLARNGRAHRLSCGRQAPSGATTEEKRSARRTSAARPYENDDWPAFSVRHLRGYLA